MPNKTSNVLKYFLVLLNAYMDHKNSNQYKITYARKYQCR